MNAQVAVVMGMLVGMVMMFAMVAYKVGEGYDQAGIKSMSEMWGMKAACEAELPRNQVCKPIYVPVKE